MPTAADTRPSILVVDDEQSMREFLSIMLTEAGYHARLAAGGAEALEAVESTGYDLMLCDMKMPEVGGLEVLKRSRIRHPDTPVIMITAYSSTEDAVEAMKVGAYDYITKPFKVDEIRLIIDKALDARRLAKENKQLKDELHGRSRFDSIVGASPSMQEIYDLLERMTDSKANVLLTGESGTGKEIVARAIHYNGPRRAHPFVTINCGAIPENLLESEFFGHKKGAFTGAHVDKKGLFEKADKGTVLLDEVGELPKALQVKLLRVIQEKSFIPVGGSDEVTVDVRIIAATNRNLEEDVENDLFREDLYYRLNVIQIAMPPLRARTEDIPRLAYHFLHRYAEDLGKRVTSINPAALALLERYDYPGNVRELENIIERAVALTAGEEISPDNLPPKLSRGRAAEIPGDDVGVLPEEGLDLQEHLQDLERALIAQALERANGDRGRAADLLRINARALRYRMNKLGLS